MYANSLYADDDDDEYQTTYYCQKEGKHQKREKHKIMYVCHIHAMERMNNCA